MRTDLTPHWTDIPEYTRLQRAIVQLDIFMGDAAQFDIISGHGNGIQLSVEQWNEYISLDITIEPNKHMVSIDTSAAPTKWLRQARKIEKFLKQFS